MSTTNFLNLLISSLSQPENNQPVPISTPTNKYRFQQPLLFQRAHVKSIPFTYTNSLGQLIDTGDRLYFNGQSSTSMLIGPTKNNVCSSSLWSWNNPNVGDWIDSTRTRQGTTQFSQSGLIANGLSASVISIDVTSAMQYIYSNKHWCTFMLRPAISGGTLNLVGPCNTTATTFSTINISYTDGTSEVLQNWVISSLNPSTSYTNAMDEIISSSASTVLEFFRPTMTGKVVQTATMNLSITNTAGGSIRMNVFICSPPIPNLTQLPGIAQNYTLDSGITGNPNVIVNQLITDSMTLSDVLDVINSGSYSNPFTPGNNPATRGELTFDPTLWGTPGVDHLANIATPTQSQLNNLYPNKNFGKWVGTTWPEYFNLIHSDNTAALANGFTPLAPGLGAIELTMPGRNIQNGQSWFDSGETGTNVDLYFDRSRIGQVNDIYMRYYVLLGAGWDAKDSDFRTHFTSSYTNVGLYPEQYSGNPTTLPKRSTDFTGKFFGGTQQVTAGAVIPVFTYPTRQKPDGTPDDTTTYQYVGGGYGVSSGTLGFQGRCRFQQGFFKENHPGPACGGMSWGIEMYDFGYNSHCIPSQTFVSNWDSSATSSATANGGIGFMYPGKWYCLELHWKQNTLSPYTLPPRGTDTRESGFLADGQIEFYVDGILAQTTPTFATRRSPVMDWATQIAAGVPFGNSSSSLRPITNVDPAKFMGFASIAGNLYYGGRSPNPRTKKVYINGIVAATNYIGPMKGVTRENGGLEVPSPAYINNAISRTWNILPGNTLSNIDPEASPLYNQNYPAPAPWRGNSGISSTFNAWCGGCFDQRGRFWMNIPGGHGDYAGNASYMYDLNLPSPTWKMVGVPSGSLGQPAVVYADGLEAGSVYSDGRPRSVHTWNAQVYAPGTGPILAAQTGLHSSGSFYDRWLLKFDETTGEATFSSLPTASGNSTTIAACFDPTRGTNGSVWRRWSGTSVIQRYDIANNTWTNVGNVQVYIGECSMTYLPTFDCILIGNGSGGSQTTPWSVFDCATGIYHTPTFTGAPAVGSSDSNGFWPGNTQPQWVSSLGKVCAWNNVSNTTSIMTLTPGVNPRTNDWSIGSISVSGSNTVTPTSARPNGTYGRFMFWEAANSFILLNEHNTTGYFFKL